MLQQHQILSVGPLPSWLLHQDHADRFLLSPGCFPFADKDPFIIDRRPHVYFIGNQPSFETTVVGADTESGELTRIILLPKFAETGLVALVNIASETLECKTVQISVPEWELEKVKVTMTEEEIEKARANAAIVTSDLDMMADGNEW